MVMLSIQNLTWTEGGLFSDCSLSWSAGEKISIRGPSGSGKTVFLRSIVGLEARISGEIFFNGQLVRGVMMPQFRSKAAYIPQQPIMIAGTIEENLKLPFTFAVHKGKQFSEHIAKDYLGAVGLGDLSWAKDARSLSVGQSQRLSIVRSLLCNPDILVLDEPTSALDSENRESVEALVEQWFSDRRLLVWTSHDENDLWQVTRRYVFSDSQLRESQLKEGQI